MSVSMLILIPLVGLILVSTKMYHEDICSINKMRLKAIALNTSVLTLLASFAMFAVFDFSNNQFQFVEEYYEIGSFDLYLGVDGLSIYFVLLTTIIMPVSLLSN